ncbi:MAG TPA: hypothetical protein VD902_12250, partial [Symbiobacteriaceae bacterium]|nr:hypothetical protein [Symbiobacteriaceae bacterium]
VDRGIAMALEASAPVVCLSFCSITVSSDVVRTQVPGLAWQSRTLARLLREGTGVTLVAATLGPGVEELTSRLFAEEEYALATAVDAAGSALVQSLSLYVQRHVAAGGAGLTALYGPGYGDWDILDQVGLTEAAGGALAGIECSPACYLNPQKSLVGLLGWVAGARGEGGCTRCGLRDCAYRVGSGTTKTG